MSYKILKIIMVLLYGLSCFKLSALNIEYPIVTYRSIKHCVIYRLVLESDYAAIFFYYKNPYDEGWVNFSNSTILKDLNNQRSYRIMFANGIELSPNKSNLDIIGQGLYFSLIFPAISKETKYIAITENKEDGFDFVIKLSSDRNRYSQQYKVMNDFIANQKFAEEERKRQERERQERMSQFQQYNKGSVEQPSVYKSRKRKKLKKNPNFKID